MSIRPVTAVAAALGAFADPPDVAAFERDEPDVRRLVLAAAAGDRDAFGELVVRHEHIVFRTALAALGRREDAEDAAQEAFVVAWRKLPGFRGQASFRTWLLTIAWRKALDRRRARNLWWRRTQTTNDLDTAQIDDVRAETPTPERQTLARDWTARVQREILTLSPKLRDALLLAASGEHSYQEIAAMLAVPVGTLKWRVSEARRLLGARVETWRTESES